MLTTCFYWDLYLFGGCANNLNQQRLVLKRLILMEIAEDDLLRYLGDAASEGYFVFSVVERKALYLSKAFKRIWNLEEAGTKLNAERLWQLIHPEDTAYIRECLEALKKKEKVKAEFKILRGEEIRYIDGHAYPIGADGSLIAGYIADVTDVKSNVFYAEKINARKNAMLAVLAHDLKEPVAVINMMASAIKGDAAVVGNTTILNHIKVIEELCARNIALIKDLMQREFLESPELGLRKERADMVNAMADILRQYKSSESVIEREFVFVADAESIYATVDMLKIAQSVNNLIVNAIKFTPQGGRIELKVIDKGDNVQLAVSDNGIGIPDDLKPYLFDHRTRAHRLGLRGEEGGGIGLSIIKLLVELHAGNVWVESREGKGSTFFIELPKGV
jgi:two-component system sensor histidine kinase VicK